MTTTPKTVTLKLTPEELNALDGTLSGVWESEMSPEQRSALDKIHALTAKIYRRRNAEQVA